MSLYELSIKKKAKQIAKSLRKSNPNYTYLRYLFRYLREELAITPPSPRKTSPYVPTEEEMQRYYKTVWASRNFQDMLLIKLMIYTGIRVSEIVCLTLEDVDLDACRIQVVKRKKRSARLVPFPASFRETLALHREKMRKKSAYYLFESNRGSKYTTRSIHLILSKYARKAKLSSSISPRVVRNFLFSWLRKQGLKDVSMQNYIGYIVPQTLEKHANISIEEVEKEYGAVIGKLLL